MPDTDVKHYWATANVIQLGEGWRLRLEVCKLICRHRLVCRSEEDFITMCLPDPAMLAQMAGKDVSTAEQVAYSRSAIDRRR